MGAHPDSPSRAPAVARSPEPIGLRANLDNGKTLSLALPADIERWGAIASDPETARRIRSIVLIKDGVSNVLPGPRGFRRVDWMVEMGSDPDGTPASIRCGYVADEMMVWMTLYLRSSPAMVRMDVRRTGKSRYMPGR